MVDETSSSNLNLKVLFILNSSAALCNNMIIPLLPLLVTDLGANVTEASSVIFIGYIISAIVIFPSGILSDRYRRRNIIAASFLLYAFSCLYLSLVNDWVYSIVGIALFLSSFSLFIPSRQTMIADNANSRKMATTYGIMNLAWPIGIMIGPVIAGLLADNYGWNHVFYAITLLSLASIFPVLLFKRTYKGDKRKDKKLEKKLDKKPFFRKKFLLLVVLSLFLFIGNGARGIMNLVVPLYLTETFNANKTTVGLFVSLGFGLAILLTQIPSGKIADRFDARKILACCTVPLPLLAVFWPLLDNYSFLLVLYMLMSGLWSMTWPVTSSYLMNVTPSLERGRAMSFRQAAVMLGFTVGPVIGGYFWNTYGPVSTFYVSGVLYSVAFLLAFFLKE